MVKLTTEPYALEDVIRMNCEQESAMVNIKSYQWAYYIVKSNVYSLNWPIVWMTYKTLETQSDPFSVLVHIYV